MWELPRRRKGPHQGILSVIFLGLLSGHSVPLILQHPRAFLVLGFLVVEPCNFHMKAQRTKAEC